MSKLYGTIQGARGVATRCGNKDLRVAAQSYDGSLITNLSYDDENKLNVELRTSEYSDSYGDNVIFRGTLDELIKKLA